MRPGWPTAKKNAAMTMGLEHVREILAERHSARGREKDRCYNSHSLKTDEEFLAMEHLILPQVPLL